MINGGVSASTKPTRYQDRDYWYPNFVGPGSGRSLVSKSLAPSLARVVGVYRIYRIQRVLRILYLLPTT